MEAESVLGILVTLEDGLPRLRPLECVPVDGEWWTAVPGDVVLALASFDGQPVELLLILDGTHAHIHGTLACDAVSRDAADAHIRSIVRIIPDTPPLRKAA